MPAPDPVHDVTARNRENWNRIAVKREGQPAALFRDGGSTLAAFERDLAGEIASKRVLQLACSTGDEVLSWANLGATAIGLYPTSRAPHGNHRLTGSRAGYWARCAPGPI